jgi:hypothetical protein
MNTAIFDYTSMAKEFKIPESVIKKIEKEVKKEIPDDNMMMELHVLRALKAYMQKYQTPVENEN